jgi:HD superfamily phosphodiesterase
MGGTSSTNGKEIRNAYNISVGKLEDKMPLERPSRRREDNIRLDLRGSKVNTVMNLRVP